MRQGNLARDKICIDSPSFLSFPLLILPLLLSTIQSVLQSASKSNGIDLLSAKRVCLVVSSPTLEFVVDTAALIDSTYE